MPAFLYIPVVAFVTNWFCFTLWCSRLCLLKIICKKQLNKNLQFSAAAPGFQWTRHGWRRSVEAWSYRSPTESREVEWRKCWTEAESMWLAVIIVTIVM